MSTQHQTLSQSISDAVPSADASRVTMPLTSWRFDTLTLDGQGRELRRQQRQAGYYTERLSDRAPLDMVAIPAGHFLMGSPAAETNTPLRESPQHPVQVASFYLSKYPITQIQWMAVAKLPPVRRPLRGKPARFRGDARPVETVSWLDAVEFCDRLSWKTGRRYRLPSEAQWEYGCRAGTTTPFSCGETLNTNLANYDGRHRYGQGRMGRFRQKTTVVGSFLPNGFGLYDMQGNVWEWCADFWHPTYENAPQDGRIWLENGDEGSRPLRGGSWMYFPSYCRAATRIHYSPQFKSYNVGFRVACDA